MSLFQPNLRKQIRNLPKILNFVKKIHYYSKLFTSLLRPLAAPAFPLCADARRRGDDLPLRGGGLVLLRVADARPPGLSEAGRATVFPVGQKSAGLPKFQFCD